MRWAWAILGMLVLVFSGCVMDGGNLHASLPMAEDNPQYETRSIGGFGKQYNVSSEKNLILVVSGTDNDVWVDKDTKLSQVILSGSGNLVHISGTHRPKMMRSGLQNLIVRYD